MISLQIWIFIILLLPWALIMTCIIAAIATGIVAMIHERKHRFLKGNAPYYIEGDEKDGKVD